MTVALGTSCVHRRQTCDRDTWFVHIARRTRDGAVIGRPLQYRGIFRVRLYSHSGHREEAPTCGAPPALQTTAPSAVTARAAAGCCQWPARSAAFPMGPVMHTAAAAASSLVGMLLRRRRRRTRCHCGRASADLTPVLTASKRTTDQLTPYLAPLTPEEVNEIIVGKRGQKPMSSRSLPPSFKSNPGKSSPIYEHQHSKREGRSRIAGAQLECAAVPRSTVATRLIIVMQVGVFHDSTQAAHCLLRWHLERSR